MDFCECRSIYTFKINKDTSLYEKYCKTCNKFVPLDSQVLHEVLYYKDEEKKVANKIQAVCYDNTYKMVSHTCPKCGHGKIRYFLNDVMKRTYVCPNCRTYWK